MLYCVDQYDESQIFLPNTIKKAILRWWLTDVHTHCSNKVTFIRSQGGHVCPKCFLFRWRGTISKRHRQVCSLSSHCCAFKTLHPIRESNSSSVCEHLLNCHVYHSKKELIFSCHAFSFEKQYNLQIILLLIYKYYCICTWLEYFSRTWLCKLIWS